jgi:uncharacterized protein (DUF736 family)
MTEYDNTNRGVLFREYEKESEKHPDYKGSINIEGKDYWLSGWKQQSKKGANYLSLSVKPKEDKSYETDEVHEVEGEFNLNDVPF